jgi:clan AA aspartic protease (TIGR02281 family)
MSRGRLGLPLLFVFLAASSLLIPGGVHSEFYKYVDKDGKMHFVDDPAKIPKEYREKKEVYKQPHDALPEEERHRSLEREREALEELRKAEEEEELLRKEEREERELRRRKEEEARALKRRREEEARKWVTNVAIRGNQVIVPVTVAHEGEELEVHLLLDTGATSVVLHRRIADKLKIDTSKADRIPVQVVGGRILPAHRMRLSRMSVGPIEREDVEVLILEERGSSAFMDGLLGMTFLRGLEYTVDFDRGWIRWKP